MYRHDTLVRTRIREEMRAHGGYLGLDSGIDAAIGLTLVDDQYDLTDGRLVRRAMEGEDDNPWSGYVRARAALSGPGVFERRMRDASSARATARRALIIPKFAAACALHLRSKLGAMPINEANTLLVQRKYLEVCRRRGVREVDIVLHQQFVVNAVFTEGALDELAITRRRLPKWVMWLDSVVSPDSIHPTAC